jgi:hypothetical protein
MLYDTIAEYARTKAVSRTTAYSRLSKWELLEIEVKKKPTIKKKASVVFMDKHDIIDLVMSFGGQVKASRQLKR